MNLKDLIDNYKMPQEAVDLVHNHSPLGLSGPTGAGKGTLAQYLTQTGKYSPIVSDTTRLPRALGGGKEVNGVHYWFVTNKDVLEKLHNNAYIEAKLVHGDTVYGTSIAAYRSVVDAGRRPILEIDVQGMEEFMESDQSFESIMLLPPDFKTWNQRLDGRGAMELEEKIKRFTSAVFEFDKLLKNERFYPVVNTEVVQTAELITSGAYRDPAYREQALTIARGLHSDIKAFLDSHV